ncbi:hypothetical protein ABSA28_00268 [Candidatus Hepatincolaceae symbiont of Richtersius coronifer]
MLKNIVRLLILSIICLGIFWLKNTPNTVSIQFMDYNISTSVLAMFLLLALILIPIMFLRYGIKKISTSIGHKFYTSLLIKLINTFDLNTEKFILVALLEKDATYNQIKAIKDLKILINTGQYKKALNIAMNLKIKPELNFISLYCICLIYKHQNQEEQFIAACRQGVLLKEYNAWFFVQLAEILLFTDSIINLHYLNEMLPKINFDNSGQLEKYSCLIKYKLAEKQFKENKVEEPIKIAAELVKKYPKFTPAYGILLNIYNYKQDKKKVKEYLEKLWEENPNYDGIKMWVTFYKSAPERNIEEEFKSLFANKAHHDMNMLLLAELHIKANKLLEANDALQKITVLTLHKQLTEIALLEKEKNHIKIGKILDSIAKKHSKNSWWSAYIH